MDSGPEELMPRLLPVGDCEPMDDFDPAAPPRTPQEYLRRVQIEAARCPDVVIAQIDPKKLRKKQTVSIALSGCQPAPEGYSPSLRWQQQQVSQFSAVRQSLNKHRSHWKSQPLDSNVLMPSTEDEESWKRFCLGERLYSDLAAALNSENENLGIDYIKVGFPPLLSIVSRMSQHHKLIARLLLSHVTATQTLRIILRSKGPESGFYNGTVTSVLEYLVNWFEERDFTPELGRWLYALLASLEKPLLPEAHSLIRQLARRCSQVRAGVEHREDERVSALNLFICLVGRYFEQRDLADSSDPS